MNTERVAVVGLGLLGRGIAACFLGHGFEVVALARQESRLAEARRHLEQMMGELAESGLDPRWRDQWSARVTLSTDFAALGECSVVVESVLEDLAIKSQTFDRIESVVDARAVLASNSSAIPVSLLQRGRKHPERMVGMHWAEPAHATRFLELIRGEQTSDQTVETVAALARRLGKEPSVCRKELPGFIVNRIGYAMYREALHLLESGVADVETIDRSVRNALGLWATICGPFRWMDLTGGPELYCKAMEPVLPTLCQAEAPASRLRDLARGGARGILNGRGFYDYTPEEARSWEELYRRHAWRVAQMQNEYFAPVCAPASSAPTPPAASNTISQQSSLPQQSPASCAQAESKPNCAGTNRC